PRSAAVTRYLNAYGLGVLDAVETVATEASATPAQVALAWLAAQPAVAAPIASATRVSQIEELLGSLRLTLTQDQLARLDASSRRVDQSLRRRRQEQDRIRGHNKTMTIDIYSDIVGPWCYIGERRLQRALATLPPGEQVDVVYRPYQLDPGAPET